MKILYAVQGTGNGHISRARDIIPLLMKKGEVDVLVSGTESDLDLPYEVSFRFKGMSFIFGKSGGVDLKATFKKASLINLIKEVLSLNLKPYDLVINDFEPVSAWAAKFRGVHCISLSHQCSLLYPEVPQPKKSDWFGEWILKNYAPTKAKYGFHFERYHERIFTPVIREQVRQAKHEKGEHYTVYLPSFSEEYLLKKLKKIKNATWHVFSKHTKQSFVNKNVNVYPLDNDAFIKSMATSCGVLCGAGFEAPAEALYLRKKLLVVPMKNQVEQLYNAASLRKMGVMVIKNLKKDNLIKLQYWVDYGELAKVSYLNQTNDIINTILDNEYYARNKEYSDIITSTFQVNSN